jgi:hypothetical protein
MPIEYSTSPPSAPKLTYLRLTRLGPSQLLCGAITCTQPIRVNVHYLGGRTLPCLGDDCPGCTAQRQKREETYLSIIGRHDKQHIIVGITKNAAFQLSEQVQNWHNMRGVLLDLKRVGPKVNGRVNVHVSELRANGDTLPAAPILIDHLFNIWGIDQEILKEDHPLFNFRSQFLAIDKTTNGDGLRKAK